MQVNGTDSVKKVFVNLERDVHASYDEFVELLGEEARYFVQGRLDGQFPQPDGITLIDTYYHDELDREVDHYTVKHTKTGRLSNSIDIDTRGNGFDVVASAIDPFSGKDYAVSVVEDDYDYGNTSYLEFAPLKIGEELKNGGLMDVFRKSFNFIG